VIYGEECSNTHLELIALQSTSISASRTRLEIFNKGRMKFIMRMDCSPDN